MAVYQNVDFAVGRSKFVTVTAGGVTNELAFKAHASRVPVSGGRVDMAYAEVTLNAPLEVVVDQTSAIKQYVNESVKISFNVQKGSAHFAALCDEVIRVIEVARTSYNLDQGLVPTTNATFTAA